MLTIFTLKFSHIHHDFETVYVHLINILMKRVKVKWSSKCLRNKQPFFSLVLPILSLVRFYFIINITFDVSVTIPYDVFTCSCFMKVGYAFYFANLLIILLLLVFNFIIFTLVLQKLTCRRTSSNKTADKTVIFNRAVNALAISGLLGLTWVFGFFTIFNEYNLVFQVLFAVCNSFQGLFIFMLFCVRQKEVRDSWKKCFACAPRRGSVSNTPVEMSTSRSTGRT